MSPLELKYIMHSTGLTQKDIRQILGVARRTVQDWLAGLNAIPSLPGRVLRSIASHPDYAAVLIESEKPFKVPVNFKPPPRLAGRPKKPNFGTKTFLIGF